MARGLLGQTVVRRLPGGETLTGRIVETEAYLADDPSMFLFRAPNRRSHILFGPPGHASLYLTYRVHLMFNISCGPEGVAEAVLIRALEPLAGVETMRRLRGGVQDARQLTNGPGKLTAALGLTTALSGADVTEADGGLCIAAHSAPPFETVTTTRIGLSRGGDLPYRFYIRNNPWVSRLAPPGGPR